PQSCSIPTRLPYRLTCPHLRRRRGHSRSNQSLRPFIATQTSKRPSSPLGASREAAFSPTTHPGNAAPAEDRVEAVENRLGRSIGITGCPADFDGLAGRDRRWGGADVGELDRSRRRRGLELLRIKPRHAPLIGIEVRQRSEGKKVTNAWPA